MWLLLLDAYRFTFSPDQGLVPSRSGNVNMQQQLGLRQTKKQKKALAFRTGQKTGKRKKVLDDEDVLGFPVDEDQDLAGLADLPPEVEEVSGGGRSGSRKGKAQDVGHRQAQSEGSKKRKRAGGDDVEEKPRKRSKAHPVASKSDIEDDEDRQEVEKKAQPQRFILFIGMFLPPPCRRTAHPPRPYYRQFEVFYNKGCYSCPLLFMRYGALTTWPPYHRSHTRSRVRTTSYCPATYTKDLPTVV